MNRRCLCVLVFLICPIAVFAQQGGDAAAVPVAVAPAEAGQFDFLLGQWKLEVHPKVSSLAAMIHGTPRLLGNWKASRSSDGLGIDDEMRIVDGSGNPLSALRTHRAYVQAEKRWKTSSSDTASARSGEATGQWQDGEMHLDGRFTDTDGNTTLTRTRYYGITANAFHMQQDRSTDNGENWDEAVLTIDATREAVSAIP